VGDNTNPVADGTSNTALGENALRNNLSGAQNTAVGCDALQSVTGANDNAAVGYKALNLNLVGQNTAVGSQALLNNTNGSNNVAVGFQALTLNTTAFENTAVGSLALSNNTVGTLNSAVGYKALVANSTGTFNTALGAFAAQSNSTGVDNTAVGTYASFGNQVGSDNTSVGYNALYFNIASQNTAVGSQALFNNTSGTGNIGVGYQALNGNGIGSANTVVGYQGMPSGRGSNNIIIGCQAGQSLTSNESNNIYVGATGVAGEANTIRIGTENFQTGAFMAGIYGTTIGGSPINVIVNASGQLGTSPSQAFIDRILAYNSTAQAVTTAGSFQTITFNNPFANVNWTFNGSTTWTAEESFGVYLITYSATVQRTSGSGTNTFSMICAINNQEVQGSQVAVSTTQNNVPITLSRSVIVGADAGATLSFAMTADTTAFELTPAGTVPSPGALSAITITLNRVA
jgi:hypothetical protein